MSAGHPGRDKTFSRLASRYWWPKIRESVKEFVAGCPTCQLTKHSRQKTLGFPKSLPVPKRPWQHITANFIVELPPSQGFNAILSAIFIPTTTLVTSEEFAHLFLLNVFRRFGLPNTLTTNRDTQFTAKAWSTMAKLLGITRKLSTSYHPQTNGQTEIVNQWLEQYLRVY
ncbi:hypothetical protein B9479_008180 [Cryptococcus floricola]|uniref:Integrase catalytic domain-containing protein n=1 Tax=Cryptococcus floricola TaxID=2591691 RepID=A0A5D3AM18_9TREE|nr:hypothetical protein B9479_008180 [Cryptococcus floricola]